MQTPFFYKSSQSSLKIICLGCQLHHSQTFRHHLIFVIIYSKLKEQSVCEEKQPSAPVAAITEEFTGRFPFFFTFTKVQSNKN